MTQPPASHGTQRTAQDLPSAKPALTLAGPRVLIAGLGSPHGDDQVGWQVAQQLQALLPRSGSTVCVRMAQSPADLLDWLEDCDRLIVVDACQTGGRPGSVYTWGWPLPKGAACSLRGTHDLTLSSALALASQLGWLPHAVEVWGVEIESGQAGAAMTPCALRAAQQCLEQLLVRLKETCQPDPAAHA